MRILLNGEAVSVEADDLMTLLSQSGFAGKRCATAVNEEFVPEASRSGCRLREGDRVEILTPMQGG